MYAVCLSTGILPLTKETRDHLAAGSCESGLLCSALALLVTFNSGSATKGFNQRL